MYNTYNGWKQRGRQVLVGARGQYRNEYGDYMFHINQTKLRGGAPVRYDTLGRPYVRKYL